MIWPSICLRFSSSRRRQASPHGSQARCDEAVRTEGRAVGAHHRQADRGPGGAKKNFQLDERPCAELAPVVERLRTEAGLSATRACQIVGISRSRYYAVKTPSYLFCDFVVHGVVQPPWLLTRLRSLAGCPSWPGGTAFCQRKVRKKAGRLTRRQCAVHHKVTELISEPVPSPAHRRKEAADQALLGRIRAICGDHPFSGRLGIRVESSHVGKIRRCPKRNRPKTA